MSGSGGRPARTGGCASLRVQGHPVALLQRRCAERKRTTMGKRGAFILIVLVLGALIVPSVPVFAQDPFAGLTSTLNSSARNWAAALMLVGALIAGGAIMMGSHEAGR